MGVGVSTELTFLVAFCLQILSLGKPVSLVLHGDTCFLVRTSQNCILHRTIRFFCCEQKGTLGSFPALHVSSPF